MLLGPITPLDCVVFCIIAAPQLLIQVGLVDAVVYLLGCVPFIFFQLPRQLLREYLFSDQARLSPYSQNASAFEDVVIKIVRFAFVNIPPNFARVFLSKGQSLPWLRWRMLRHGLLRWPVDLHEIKENNFKGVWAIKDPGQPPDIVLYYVHGGGFSMGSTYFYLEFLLAWHSLLSQEANFKNPAIFGLEYTLVPEAVYPTQIHEVMHGYEFVIARAGGDASKVVVGADSAGATLALSLLLYVGRQDGHEKEEVPTPMPRLQKPGMVVLISPWVTLMSELNANTDSDYLDGDSLRQYARAYAGRHDLDDPLVSPGTCHDTEWWRHASPTRGVWILYGAEEVFAGEARRLVTTLTAAKVPVSTMKEPGEIHAWPVVNYYLGGPVERRLKGLKAIVGAISQQMGGQAKA